MFPATSLPRRFGTPGRTRTRNLDVRSVALFQLSYRSVKELEHRTGFEPVSGASATPCLGPSGLTIRRAMRMVGEDRVESRLVGIPRTRMLRYTTPRSNW